MQRIEGAGGGYFSVTTPEGKKIKIQTHFVPSSH